MEIVDFAHREQQISNAERSISFNPAILVLALVIYVLLFISGILTNSRVIEIIRRRIRRNPFTFEIRLIELDVLSLCCTNLVSVLCFLFVIFDLVYGRWMTPSKILCRFYLSADGFTRVASGMTLARVIFLCVYFVWKSKSATDISNGILSKIFFQYLYLVLCPAVGVTFAMLLFQHGDAHMSSAENQISYSDNETEPFSAKCGLTATNKMATSLLIFESICGYLAPTVAFILVAIFCRCRCRNISDLTLGRYSGLAANYGVLFVICRTPAWIVSVFLASTTHTSNIYYEHADFLNYIAHTIGYFPCVGYPVLYLRSLGINRISHDLSGDSLADVARDDTAMSLTSAQRFSRDVSCDVLLSGRHPMRSRTTSMLHVTSRDAIVSVTMERHASYHALPDAGEEDQV